MMSYSQTIPQKSKFAPALLLVALNAGCGSTSEQPLPTAAEKEAADIAAAATLCMDTLHGKVELRAEAIDALLTVTDTYPNNAYGHYFLGMCSLAAFVEDGSIAGRGRVEPALSRTVELDPGIINAVGNLALQRFNTALFLKNPMDIDAATKELIAAADADVFNTFVLSFGLIQLERDTPYPQMAADRLDAYNAECSKHAYCRNSEDVPHHDAGLFMHSGDAHVRVGNQAKADEYYQKALAADGGDSWAFLADAQAWAAGTADRIALHADADPTNDPPLFLSGRRTCQGCHQ